MPYGYNRYNEPSLADGFISAFGKTNDFLNQNKRDQGLADIERAPVQSTGGETMYTPPGLGDQGQNDAKSYGRDTVNDGGTPIDQGTAIDNAPGMRSVSPQQFSVQGQVADSPDAARRRARASLMRSTGSPEAANKEEEAGNLIDKGAQDVKLGAYKVKKAARDDSNDSASFEVQSQMAQYAQTQQLDASTPSGAADLAAHHVQALLQRGLTDEAEKVSKAYTNVLINQIKGTEAQRGEAVVGVQQALQTGNPGALKVALGRLDSFLPNGGRVDDVQAGPKPGTFQISRTESDGTQSQKVVTQEQLNQMLDMVTGSQFDKASQGFIKNRLDIDNVKAQINAHKAAAGASGAMAAEHAVRTDAAKYDLGNRKELDVVLRIPEEARTVKQQALVDGEMERASIAAAARPGRGGAGNDPNDKEGQIKVIDPATATSVGRMRDPADGQVKWMERSRKEPNWKPISAAASAKAVEAGVAVTAEPSAASPSAAPAGTVPPPAPQRPDGFRWKNPAGTEGRWNKAAQKWEPV